MHEIQFECINNGKQFVRHLKFIALDVQEQLANNYETINNNMISMMNLLFLFSFTIS